MCGVLDHGLRLEPQLCRQVERGKVAHRHDNRDGLTAQLHKRIVEQRKERSPVGPATARLCRDGRLHMRAVESLVDHACDKLLALDHTQGLGARGREVARDSPADPFRNICVGAIDNRAVPDQPIAALRLTISAHAAVTSNVI